MRKNLVIPLLLLSVISYGQTTINNFYTTMSILNLDSLKSLPDSSKSYDTKTIVRADLMWRSQLAPHGNPSVASAGIINYANSFVAPSNSNSLTGGSSNSTEIGPIGTPSNSGGDGNGQINRIAFDPNYNGTTNKVMYAGSFHGGLWKSTDGGNNWLVHGTDDQLPITSVSGIAISHQNTNKLFVCTGDGDERDFVIDYNTNLDGRNPNFTIGVYRSLDDGLSWNPINLGLTKDAANNPINFADGGVCRQLRINPNDESILFVATSRGLYRSTNATDVNAPSWSKLNVNNNTNWMDDYRGLEFHPTNSNIVYTSSKDIFKSTNGGNVWTSMTGPGTGLDLATTNSHFSIKRINITVTPGINNKSCV